MLLSVENQIYTKISKEKKGLPFFAENFSAYGSPAAIRKALDRLVRAGKLNRVARGIYMRQKMDDVVGPLTPSIEELAKAIARRDRARIAPTGVYALNRLGLSTQVPANIIYLTDGAARKVRIGRRTITFKRTTPKNVAAIGQTSKLVIQALRAIGKDNMTDQTIKQIHVILKHEDKNRLAHDMMLAPAWIREIIKPVLR